MYLCSAAVKVKVRIDNHSSLIHMKAVAVNGSILMSHLDYLLQCKLNGRRKGWLEKSIQSIRLLIDYSYVNKNVFETPAKMFEVFSQRLFDGTIDSEGYDPTNLRWAARSENSANEIIRHITKYSDWLFEQKDGTTELLNPQKNASSTERLMNLAAYNHRMNRSFLKHTYTDTHRKNSTQKARVVSYRNKTPTSADPRKPFNEDKIWDLLVHGFIKSGQHKNSPVLQKYNLANLLITILMHYGGLRVSEVFHIYVDDIIPNVGLEQIRVYHPTEGLAPQWYRDFTRNQHCTRKQFLLEKYGLQDRLSSNEKKYHAGWKNPVVSNVGKYFPVFLFGDNIESVFFKLFRLYVEKQRVPPLTGREHPFLFTNRNGDPLSIKSFVKKHQAAVQKIGLLPYLEFGGSPHSHRHSYGQRLADAKKICPAVDEFVIKGAMHHSSLESQKTYTEPHIKKIAEQLSQAIHLISDNNKARTGIETLQGN